MEQVTESYFVAAAVTKNAPSFDTAFSIRSGAALVLRIMTKYQDSLRSNPC